MAIRVKLNPFLLLEGGWNGKDLLEPSFSKMGGRWTNEVTTFWKTRFSDSKHDLASEHWRTISYWKLCKLPLSYKTDIKGNILNFTIGLILSISLGFHEGLSGGEGNCLTALRAKDMLILETLLGRSPM